MHRRARSGAAHETPRTSQRSFRGRGPESWIIPQKAESSGEVAVIGVTLDITEVKLGERELRAKLDLIERQEQMIRVLATPIIEVWDRVLCLPILGLVDSARTAEIMDNLLHAIVRARARVAILDLTGVEVVDTETVGYLVGLVRAIELLGARGIITGIHPNIAQTMVSAGIDLSGIRVHVNLRSALKECVDRGG